MPGSRTEEQERLDKELDEELDSTFPASDPPSVTQPQDPDGEDETEA